MSGPWEEYQDASGPTPPWEQYGGTTSNTTGGGGGWSDQEPMDWLVVGREAIDNLGPSLVQLGQTILYPIQHPIRFMEGMYRLTSGGVQKLIPGEQQNEVAFDAFVNAMVDRYGSIDNIKRTIAEDPAGAFADAAGILMVGGGALNALGRASRIGALSKAGRTVSGVGGIVDPVNVARQAIALPARGIGATGLPRALLESALKPSKRPHMFKDAGKREQLFKTAVDSGIYPTKGGFAKAGAAVSRNMDDVNRIIEAGTGAGHTAPRKNIIQQGALPVMERAGKTIPQTTSERSVMNVVTDFIERNPDNLTPRQMQDMKTATGRQLTNRAFDGQVGPFTRDAIKGLRYGLRQQLEAMYPELSNLNRNSKEMLDLMTAMEDAMPRINNKNLIGLSDWVMGAGAASNVGRSAGASGSILGALAAKMVFGHPKVKAALGVALGRAARHPNIGQNIGKSRVAAQGLLQGQEAIDSYNNTAR